MMEEFGALPVDGVLLDQPWRLLVDIMDLRAFARAVRAVHGKTQKQLKGVPDWQIQMVADVEFDLHAQRVAARAAR